MVLHYNLSLGTGARSKYVITSNVALILGEMIVQIYNPHLILWWL